MTCPQTPWELANHVALFGRASSEYEGHVAADAVLDIVGAHALTGHEGITLGDRDGNGQCS